MRLTVSFNVKNYVEVMEGWPIKDKDVVFSLECEDQVLKRVCITFCAVSIEYAPTWRSGDGKEYAAHITDNSEIYVTRARNILINWQAVISGLQVFSIDFDGFALSFHPESAAEEQNIHLRSLKSEHDETLNAACDFEQIGRAFCVGSIKPERIESTAHFRDGRIAFAAGRFVDAYNNMFLFLETRYCDGKTALNQQIDLLSSNASVCAAIQENTAIFTKQSTESRGPKFDIFKPDADIREKIRSLVLLRGKLRHHSLKSSLRWDPNNQNQHETAARFLGAVVGNIVSQETLADIYSPPALEMFRKISVSTGYETKIKLTTYRMEKKPSLELNMSYPTTVASSQLCANATREAMRACLASSQLADTVKFEASDNRSNLELFSLELGIWAYTASRSLEASPEIGHIRCSFEHYRRKLLRSNEFSIPFTGSILAILDAWSLFERCFDHIENRDPTTRIMRMKLYVRDDRRAIASYRVGAIVKN